MTTTHNLPRSLALLALAASLLAMPAAASDHADPIKLTNLEAGLTGLFAFPDPETGENLVLVLTVRRGLTAGPPYKTVPDFEYTIHFDLESFVDFTNKEHLARYGGNVVSPDGITEHAAIHFRLTDSGKLQGAPRLTGKLEGATVRAEAGVFDDPFIFPRFFEKNVIGMVASVPFSAFPANQKDYVIWATTTKNGKQIDTVGRSNRTQLGRLDFLNPIPPSKHVPRIERAGRFGGWLQKGLTHLMGHFLPVGAVSGLFEYVLQIRPYDAHPDVMIFTRRPEVPPGFPNGRRLPDDVAGLTCAQGDCVLQEVAFIEGGWPRKTVNDKTFSPTFPYLAPPWPDKPQHDDIDRCALVFWAIVLILLAIWIWRKRKQTAADEVPEVRPALRRPS